ncbi:MAG: thiamine-binding protein [Firmicutes bacterium]|nr:thiamine-binding protein [Bacillota bacterium]
MAEANLSLQILPVVNEDQIYGIVDQVINVIRNTNLPYVVGPMETTVEGDVDALLALVKKALVVCTEAGVARVIAVVKIDYKPSGVTIDEKIGKYRQ